MINLKPLNKNMDVLRPFISKYGGEFNELTLGSRYLWGEYEDAEYAIVHDTLILRETYEEGSFFYYPVGEDVGYALKEFEEYSKEKGVTLNLCSFNGEIAEKIKSVYPFCKIDYLRDWADYVYPAEQFITYSGKKLSGQRNHVHKFERIYTDYKVEKITKDSVPKIKEFLKEFEKENSLDGWAAEEMPKAYELLDNMDYLDQFGIYITVGGKIISLSIGEIAGDTLFVHIEKALKEYAGAYPKTAQEFAKAFVRDGVKFINREEDCGDLGLRTSKTQYHPSEIRIKYFAVISTAFDTINSPILKTERLTIKRNDGFTGYKTLCTDEEINALWGFSYKDDIEGEPTEEKFTSLVKSLREKKEEYSLAVLLGDKSIGEIVLWDFGFRSDIQIGFRFFKEYQGKGYALESVKKVVEYAFNEMKIKSIKAYCFKENLRSKNLLNKLGFTNIRSDEKYDFYEISKQ